MDQKVICIDPGHGGTDPGATNGTRLEKDDNLRMAKAVRDKLVAQGHTVVMTRQTDAIVSLDDRAAINRNTKADLFISIHRNSFTNSTACGVENWARYQNHVSTAATVLEELSKLPNQSNRGVKIGAYKVLNNSPCPAMLLELGFISNAKDNELFDKHFDDYATAIARGILTALGEGWSEPGESTGKPLQPLYRVQVGAFTVKGNAEVFLRQVQKMGLQAFLVSPELPKEE